MRSQRETEIVMSIYHTHHDPQIYANPERFDPARWETIDPNTFEYTPLYRRTAHVYWRTLATMEINWCWPAFATLPV